MAKRRLYDLDWPELMHPLAIEMAMIKRGGSITRKDGKIAGNGLLWHWKRAHEIIWPEKKWHRWNELETKCYLEHTYIGEMGCAAAGKTETASTNILFDWYLMPWCTTCLISSTDLPSLDLRAWGTIKKYHKLAKERCEWLPGHLIEGRRVIINDEKDSSVEGREFKNGLIAVPCFPSGTYVDTPNGQKKIETIRVGDLVINANGVGIVKGTSNRIAKALVRVRLNGGRCIDSTQEHPFFTERGWVKAIDLKTSDMVFSAYETMRLLRKRHQLSIPEQQILLRVQKLASRKDLRLLRNRVPANSSENQQIQSEILHSPMCFPLGLSASGIENNQEEMRRVRSGNGMSFPKGILLRRVPKQTKVGALLGMREGVHFNSRVSREAQDEILRNILQEEVQWQGYGEASQNSNEGGTYGCDRVPPGDSAFSYQHRHSQDEQCNPMERVGFGIPGCPTGRRDRRRYSSDARSPRERPEERRDVTRTRVASVEILQQAGDPRFSDSEGGYRVHNLEVEGHPSYSVNGVIVHNCKRGNAYVGLGPYVGIHNKRVRLLGDELNLMPKAMLDSTSNLSKCEDFKMVGIGQPSDTTTAHGDLCEPHVSLGGWESGIDQTPKTKTWKTKWPNGVCVQLPGSDCPNFDVPEDAPVPFPFLITRKQMKDDAEHWGVDDWHYTMMNEGRMPRGVGSHRVLTRQMCEKFHALEAPIWRDTNIKRIAFLDAGYGGDRCVFGEMNFGKAAEADVVSITSSSLIAQDTPLPSSRQLVALVDTMVIPVDASGDELPEDQIVTFVSAQCDKRGISLDDFFYDPGLRTKLTVAFSRITGKIGNPIDCGGKPTDRLVANGIDVICSDYYSKFVTELWYSVRLTVEADQFRGLTKDAMWEFCAREWKQVSGNRIELESKPDMKAKTSRSPDLADAVSIGLEGCRQRGFVIIKAGARRMRDQSSSGWKRMLEQRAKKQWTSRDLIYNA